MKMNPDDPRLTAYALGEVEPGERAAIEAELKDNPECRHAVEEIRQAAGVLSSELSAEPCPALLPQQRQTINARMEPDNIVQFPRRWFATAGIAAVAASVMFVVAWSLWIAGPDKRPNELARVENNQSGTTTTPEIVAPDPRNSGTAPVVTPANPALVKVEPATSANPSVMTISAPPAEATRAVQATPQNAATAPVAPTGVPQRDPQPVDGIVAPIIAGTAINGEKFDDATKALRIREGSTVSGGPVTAPQSAQSGIQHDYATTPALAVDQLSKSEKANARSSGGRGMSGGGSSSSLSALGPNQPIGGGGFGGSGGGGRRGGAIGGGGGRVGPLARNTVVVTQTSTTYLYDGDPERDNFTQWRYYRYPVPPTPRPTPPPTASYPHYPENRFVTALQHPLSTFSVDVDTASYANVRRFLNAGQLPPRDAVRVEEMVNYFTYHYPAPKGEDPFAATIEVAGCPWESENRLVRVGIKAREIAPGKRPPSNFVFLIDISGSMGPTERLPLIKQALRQLVRKMGEGDRVAIVVYASEAGVRLASTSCVDKERILAAIDALTAGGSTNGGEGVQEAYRVAQENFIKGGVNRVLLCTDGDFNVGMTDQDQLVRMIEGKAKGGVYLTTLGVGTDNYKDALMQKLADKGNGNYHYLDNIEEAQKVLIDQMNGTLVTVAKDVKIQVEFNPSQVRAYRLIGYEKRALRSEDFNNDAKDAGEIGAGHTVTALYEIVPAGREIRSVVDNLKYQYLASEASEQPAADRIINKGNKELLTLKLRYKHPEGDRSRLLEIPVTDNGASYSRASVDYKFAAAVASFAMILKNSEDKGNAGFGTVLELAEEAKGADEGGYRSEFINLVKKARDLRR